MAGQQRPRPPHQQQRRFQNLAAALHPAPAAGGAQMAPRGDWDPSFAPAPLRQTTARCRSAIATRDVTPPVGIYNRNWGAAAHSTIVGLTRPTGGRIARRQAQWLIANFIQYQLPTHQLPQNTITRRGGRADVIARKKESVSQSKL